MRRAEEARLAAEASQRALREEVGTYIPKIMICIWFLMHLYAHA